MANPFDSDGDNHIKGRKGLGLSLSHYLHIIFIDSVKSYTTSSSDNVEDRIADYEREVEEYMQMSVDSTQRSCKQLESSDNMAEATARVIFNVLVSTEY
jgi:hypothetical protein